MWLDYRAWVVSQTPPELADNDEDLEDAFLRAAAAGEVDANDPATRAAWIARWRAAHPTAPETAATGAAAALAQFEARWRTPAAWEPVTEPPPRPGTEAP